MSNHNIQPWQSKSPRKACENALADEIPIVFTLCRAFNLSFPSGVLLLLFLMGIALQGAACVLDGVGRRISLKINMLLLAPLASGQVLVQFLTDVVRAVEIGVAAEVVQRHAQYKASAATRVQMREQLELAIRKKVVEKVRLDALTAFVDKLLADKPQEADFVDFEQKLIDRNQRIADLELAIEQARIDGHADAVKLHRQELKRLRAAEPASYETAMRNWERKYEPAVRQCDEFGDVSGELAALNDSLAELNLREQAELEPVEPSLVYANIPIPAMCKSVGTGWPVAIGLLSGPTVLKALCRHMTPFVDMTGGRMLSKYAGGSVVTSFFATIPQDVFERDFKALGQDAAAVSGAFLVSSDANVEGFDGAMTPTESMSLPAIKEAIVKMAVDRTIAMMGARFQPTEYSLSAEALSVLAEIDETIHRVRHGGPIHPAQDALLVNMPQTICAVAGLLHAWNPNGAELQADAVDRASSICSYFDVVFGAAVVPPPEELAWAQMLRVVLCRIVAKKVSRQDKNAHVMAISTLLNKASSIGMTRAQIRRAIDFMLREGWAILQDHETDDFDEILVLDRTRFGATSAF
ncbi:hypothetical protein LA03_14005 [Burkholderia gladioli]|uniref:hypothetical protein n=1 Tax=Burkholderia gladioli TaxID=28095 RepID=UPI00050E11D1|nr:hypothetical protein [Burkholderia gladioli]KGE09810.1 hypothetical protein LA03_14005 [Burkholderia gladioli]